MVKRYEVDEVKILIRFMSEQADRLDELLLGWDLPPAVQEEMEEISYALRGLKGQDPK